MPQPLIAYEESSCITPKRSREGENPKSPKQRTSRDTSRMWECGCRGYKAASSVLFFLGGGICILLLLQKNNYNHLSQKYENQTITKPNAAFKSNRFLMTTKCAGNLKHNTDVMLLTVKHKNRNHVRLSLRRFEFISHMGPSFFNSNHFHFSFCLLGTISKPCLLENNI